jgi:hypothetical protein
VLIVFFSAISHQDMEEFTECQRRLRAVDADLVSMRALYLDETTSHAETKAAWEEGKRDWEEARQVDLGKIQELEVVAEEKEALQGEFKAAQAVIEALEAKVKVRVTPLTFFQEMKVALLLVWHCSYRMFITGFDLIHCFQMISVYHNTYLCIALHHTSKYCIRGIDCAC